VSDTYDLQRFVDAQDAGDTYAGAVRELRAGYKRGHWMWFVFPQIAGLGWSAMSQRYAISGLPEAAAYLAHPVLGPRLLECAGVLTKIPATDPVKVLGHPDDRKLQSSMTLFLLASRDIAAQHEQVFRQVLDQYFAGETDDATTSRARVGQPADDGDPSST
jgi:uncharacterized protein (DUF1810 family)